MTYRNRIKSGCLFLLLLLGVALQMNAQEVLLSPDGKYSFTFEQSQGKLLYHLSYAGKQVIETGELGVNIDNHLVESAMGIPVDTNRVWTTGMEVIKVERASKDETWNPIYGEYASIRDHYNEMIIHLMKGATTIIAATAMTSDSNISSILL